MKSVEKERKKLVTWNIIFVISIAAITLTGLEFTRKMLLEDARRMGREMVAGYSSEEEQNLQMYKNLINFGSMYINRYIAEGRDKTYIRDWIEDYEETLDATAGEDVIDLLVVAEDEILASGSRGMEEADIRQSAWYQAALASDGEVAYTDSYFSDLYGRPVITVSEACDETGVIVAFVIFPEQLRVYFNEKKLPAGSSYFMCDSEGVILYAETDLDLERLEDAPKKTYFQKIYEGAAGMEDVQQDVDIYYRDNTGRKMAVFYHEVENGWYSILTVPQAFLVGDWTTIIIAYLCMFTAGAVLFLIVKSRGKKSAEKAGRVSETIHMLSNSYYAIYRINIQTGIYEMVKAPDEIRNRLPREGSYSDLLVLLQEKIRPDMCEEFLSSFSLAGMSEKVEQNAEEFGGDFQRMFNGTYKWVNVRMMFAPTFSRNEVVLCFRQVEQEKQRRLGRMQILEDAVKIAQESKQSQSQFFSNMSHDMRTPLNVIIGMSDLALRNTADREKTEDYLHKINTASRQLLGLINDVLEISRLEQGISIRSEELNLRGLTEEIVNTYRIQVQEAHKEFSYTCELTHEWVRGDVLRLNQVLNNLLSNALKFTGEGDRISVDVSEITIGGRTNYRLRVEDTGIGMSKEFLDQLFLPYKREARFCSQVEGTGLGMPIVKSIVLLMGGEIEVMSEKDKGTVFTVLLPLESVSGRSGTEEALKEEEKEKEKEKETVLAGRRILLVEDYELNMELATDILEMNGAAVLQAVNGKEALEMFRASEEYAIDAILMDMHMPVMDGCGAAREIRRLDREDAKRIPIIALTANAFPEDISRTLNAGMNAHITKPIDVKVLCATLYKEMHKSGMEQLPKLADEREEKSYDVERML